MDTQSRAEYKRYVYRNGVMRFRYFDDSAQLDAFLTWCRDSKNVPQAVVKQFEKLAFRKWHSMTITAQDAARTAAVATGEKMQRRAAAAAYSVEDRDILCHTAHFYNLVSVFHAQHAEHQKRASSVRQTLPSSEGGYGAGPCDSY